MTLFDGQILDSACHTPGGPCLACIRRYDGPRVRRIEQGLLAFSFPTESDILRLKNSEWWSRKMLDAILFTKSGVNVSM